MQAVVIKRIFISWCLSLAIVLATAISVYASRQPKTVADYEKLVIYYRFSIPDSGVFYATKGLELSRRLQQPRGEAIMLNHLGIINENQGNFSAARQKYLIAIQIYEGLADKIGVADETIRLGVVEMRQGNFDAATSFFFKALRIHDAAKNTRGIMECSITLGEAYLGQSEYDVALTYLKTAETLSRKLPVMGLTLYVYNNLGLLYTQTGEIEKAITYYEKGISLSNEPQYAGINVTLLNGLGMAYARKGDTKRATQLQLSALKKARLIKNYLRELQTLNGLAGTYGKREPDKALAYLNQALTLAYQKHASKVAIETLKQMTALYEQKGKYELALQVNKRERDISDSIFNLASSTEIGSLQASYDLQQSKANVDRLKYLTNEQRSQKRIIIFITIGIVIILVIVIIFYARIKSYNVKLQQFNADLQANNESKDKLFSVLGHDLRAPLATVKNFLSLLEDDDLTVNERNQVVHELQHNCDASLEVLNKLLRWGQLQLKGNQVNPVNFKPAEIVAQNVRLFKNAATEKHIIINIRIDEELIVYGDADHFDFIVRNLLSNAIKFTATGGYVMIGSVVEEAPAKLSFYIKDSGIGMQPEQVEFIFRRLNVSQRGTHGEKGTGLGLMLSYEFIQANNGSIEVNSDPGKGTTFNFSFGTIA